MKKILYIGGFELPDRNAAAHRVMANAKLLREMGFEVSFVGISKDIANAPKVVDGFTNNPIPYPMGIKEWLHYIITFVDLHIIFEHQPDYVIIYNFPAIASLRILKACHKRGIKVVHDLTEWECARGRSFREFIHRCDINFRMHYCVKKMDGVIAISRYLYDYYKNYTNTILVPPLVDLSAEKWKRNCKHAIDGRIRLVYAGDAGLGTKDRLGVIVDAIARHPDMQLDVVGMTIEQFMATYGHFPDGCKNIFFHGRISHEKAIEIVQEADFQLLIRDNSLKNKAGFPTKFVESMACGTPIIATLTSNLEDYLKDSFNGFIVNENQSLDEVLLSVERLSSVEIDKMKENCKNITVFDYREYKPVFEQIFGR